MKKESGKRKKFILFTIGFILIVVLAVFFVFNITGNAISLKDRVLGACSDSDSGENYFVKGEVKLNKELYTDFCSDSKTLIEYSCKRSSNRYILFSKNFSCEGLCKSGQCVKINNVSKPRDNSTFSNSSSSPVNVESLFEFELGPFMGGVEYSIADNKLYLLSATSNASVQKYSTTLCNLRTYNLSGHESTILSSVILPSWGCMSTQISPLFRNQYGGSTNINYPSKIIADFDNLLVLNGEKLYKKEDLSYFSSPSAFIVNSTFSSSNYSLRFFLFSSEDYMFMLPRYSSISYNSYGKEANTSLMNYPILVFTPVISGNNLTLNFKSQINLSTYGYTSLKLIEYKNNKILYAVNGTGYFYDMENNSNTKLYDHDFTLAPTFFDDGVVWTDCSHTTLSSSVSKYISSFGTSGKPSLCYLHIYSFKTKQESIVKTINMIGIDKGIFRVKNNKVLLFPVFKKQLDTLSTALPSIGIYDLSTFKYKMIDFSQSYYLPENVKVKKAVEAKIDDSLLTFRPISDKSLGGGVNYTSSTKDDFVIRGFDFTDDKVMIEKYYSASNKTVLEFQAF